MKFINIVSIIITILHLLAGAFFLHSLENFYVVVTFIIGCVWVIFTGLTLDIAESKDNIIIYKK